MSMSAHSIEAIVPPVPSIVLRRLDGGSLRGSMFGVVNPSREVAEGRRRPVLFTRSG
jgi:hypothetical protein